MTPARTASWLTARRLRAHGLILALCLWSVYLWNMSTPGLRDRVGNLKGTDFLHFYTLGSLALARDGANLYDLRPQSQIAAARVPAAVGIYYLPLYPPQVAILFAPLARLPYAAALSLWIAITALIYLACCYAIWRVCPQLRAQETTVLILALAYPAFWHLIAWGQTSALALVCFSLAFFAFRAKLEFLAGLALGCLIFKPQLALAAAMVFLFTLRWRVIGGAVLSASAQMMVGWFYWGAEPLLKWIEILVNARKQLAWLEPRPYQTHCLRTFWTMLVPWPAAALTLYIGSGIVVSVFVVVCWRSRLSLSVRFSALLFASVLLAPHLTVYDLVILAPGFMLLSDWILARGDDAHLDGDRSDDDRHGGDRPRWVPLLLYLAFVLPLVGPLAQWTHLQLSVPVMAAILYVVWSYCRRLQNSLSIQEGAARL
jgi:hypothetical protein